MPVTLCLWVPIIGTHKVLGGLINEYRQAA
jgi:hypothetical protein